MNSFAVFAVFGALISQPGVYRPGAAWTRVPLSVAALQVPAHASIAMHQTRGDLASLAPISLCELLSVTAFGGYYQIGAMVSGLEPGINPNGGTQEEPFTYVTLIRLAAWSDNAPKIVVARMPGGKNKDGTWMSTQVALTAGEKIGYLASYVPANKGYPSLSPLGVFRPQAPDQGFSNSQIFTEKVWGPDEVGFIVSIDLSSNKICPLEVLAPGQTMPWAPKKP